MKAKIMIPKGWHKVRRGSAIKQGDKCWDGLPRGWITNDGYIGWEITTALYIRRKAKRK